MSRKGDLVWENGKTVGVELLSADTLPSTIKL